jgi:hypothetical protein
VPVGETRLLGEMRNLIDIVAAQAAGVGLLQRDKIVGRQDLRDAVEVFVPRAEGQGVTPGLG